MMENQIEKLINQVTSSDLFLQSVAAVTNLSSYRKIWVQKTLEKILKSLELPTRRDQEKLLALVQELEIRLKKLQLLEDQRMTPTELPVTPKKSAAAKKSSAAKRLN
jgi:hypothetical protein